MTLAIKRFIRVVPPSSFAATVPLVDADTTAFLATLNINQIQDVRYDTGVVVDGQSMFHMATIYYLIP